MIYVLLLLLAVTSDAIKIPLANVTDPKTGKVYPIHIDFYSKHTISPFRSSILPLSEMNITLPMVTNYSSNVLKIGLEYPSDFLTAIGTSLKVEQSEIQFTYHENLLYLLIAEVNFVEVREFFKKGQKIDYSIVYNYGHPIRIRQQMTKIIPGDKIYFNEYFILQVLNSMALENRISYTRKGDIIQVSGTLTNFPHIIALSGQNQIRLYLQQSPIIHINTWSSANLIGIKSIKQYSKFQVVQNGILLKRSSLSIVLYIFLGIYAAIITILIIGCRKDSQYSMGFIRNIFKATFLKDDRARVQLLMTELQ